MSEDDLFDHLTESEGLWANMKEMVIISFRVNSKEKSGGMIDEQGCDFIERKKLNYASIWLFILLGIVVLNLTHSILSSNRQLDIISSIGLLLTVSLIGVFVVSRYRPIIMVNQVKINMVFCSFIFYEMQ